MTHSLSIWPLDAELEFAQFAPCYETRPLTEGQAKSAYDAATYHTAAGSDTCADKAPAYLLSLDELDSDSIGVCQQRRTVSSVAKCV